ncbi:uncharacterized protein LOC108630322 isoform X2 [Ceratina calcarata]|uniref:Uncharacterized protein LOC108630322 isoform X2 n=1 Tax=Ceratina calcarata TaxID=156304 RepID=A0AAJ7NCX3_9HYME|nr:uncharacterized protein LOC108630322 isoform X2 [Ceratina calcarata]
MVARKILILFFLTTQALSAPTGCTEYCGSYHQQYQTQSSNAFQGQTDLSEIASRLQGLDYSRPGTWSQHKDYNVDNGHGKVHEEHGQIVDGPKTVRYYQKNYSSSYSTKYPNTGGSNIEYQNNRYGVHVPTDNTFDSQRAYSQTGTSRSTTEQNRYNQLGSQQHTQSTFMKTNAQSERFENFRGDSENLQVQQHGLPDFNTQHTQESYGTNTQPGNWKRVDSYKTDGGHGRVFTEEGQYVTGDKKVRYYKQNYTSNYSSLDGIPVPDVSKIGIQNIQQEVDKLHKDIAGLSQLSTTNTMGTSNIGIPHTMSSNYGARHYDSTLSETQRNEQSISDTTRGRLPYRSSSQKIFNPTPGYTNVHSTESSGYSKSIHSDSTLHHQVEQSENLDEHQSKLVQNQMFLDNLRNSANIGSVIPSGSTGRVPYNVHWSSSQTKEISGIPHYTRNMNQYNLQNYNQYGNGHTNQGYSHQIEESGYTSSQKAQSGKLITGEIDLGHGEDTVDCAYDSHTHSNYQHQTKYKRNTNREEEQQIDEIVQQTFGNTEFDQHSQQSYDPWKPHTGNQKLEDLTQKTHQFDDLTQQTSGKLEFGQESQQSYQPWKPNTNKNLEDLTQQTSGKLEFGQESQQSYQPWKPNTNKNLEDLTQQTSGKLEFGQESQQSYQPWKPNTNKNLEDLTQQTSGKLEFGQESQQNHQPWESTGDSLTQETDQFHDLTQQTSGKLEFGQESQQSYQPWKPNTNQNLEDLTQQTSGKLEFEQESQQNHQSWEPKGDSLTQETDQFDDLTQQTSGKLEFGQESQQSYQPWKPSGTDPNVDDTTQKTSGKLEFGQESQQNHQSWEPKGESHTQETDQFDDLTQKTSGKLEFGQESQQSYQPWKPNTNQNLEDLTQQISGKLEFGQESQQNYQPWEPKVDSLTQETDQFDDLTQQTSGKLEFGQESQQSYQPWKPNTNQNLEDLTQQTSGKLEFGQESQQNHQSWEPKGDSLTQETDQFDDLTQQTSGKLEFGQESQQSYQPWKPSSTVQNVDTTQQTSGKLEFGQESQQNHQTWEPKGDSLTQEIDQFDDLTQQTSGNLEFGQGSQQSYQPWKPNTNQNLEDLTQQTSGKLEFGQESQQSYQPWKPNTNQNLEDLTQQTSGKLEFGQESQQSHQPWKPSSTVQSVDDTTQQTSGKIEFGQESQQNHQSWEPKGDSLTQEIGQFDDLTQQTSGNLEFGQESQQSYQPWQPNRAQHIDDTSTPSTQSHPKPAEKPKPRSRYSKPAANVQFPSQGMDINNQKTENSSLGDVDALDINEIPPEIDAGAGTNIRDQNIRGDQGITSSTNKDSSKPLKETEISAYDVEGANVDQENWLHKSNDATVGLQWHYTYHPSDQRQFVQQIDQKNKEGQQELTTISQQAHEETQNKHVTADKNQQSQYYASEPGVKSVRRRVHLMQTQNTLTSDQQASDLANIQKKDVEQNESQPKLEPRILEAYGGGEYDPFHSDDIYAGVTINPSATLLPVHNEDPWYIREKPKDVMTELTPPPLPVEPLDINDTPTTEAAPPPSFWSRIGHKITNTIDKAKSSVDKARERARTIFG